MGHKTIGLLGGTTPEATISYYRQLTGEYTRRYGDFGFPQILIYSVTFQELLDLTRESRWDRVRDRVAQAFDALQAAGADFGLITANTLHNVFDGVARRTSLPLVSIVDATVEAAVRAGFECVGLLGTETTMDASFYPDALRARGMRMLLPDPADRTEVSRIIYDELARGVLSDESRRTHQRIVEELRNRGAQGVILGCTEIPLLLRQGDAVLPLLDTTRIHVERALQLAVDPQSVGTPGRLPA